MPKRILKAGFRLGKAAYGLKNTPRGKQLGKVWRAGEVAGGAAGLADLVNRSLKGREARQIAKIKRSPEYLKGGVHARTALLAGRCEKTPSGIKKCYPKRRRKK